jgi:hypothetical protein
MSQTSDALDRNEIAAARSRISQRVVHRNAGTKQRRRFVGWQVIGHERDRFRIHDHVLGVPAVEVNRRDLSEFAVHEITAAARIAFEAVSSMPAHADALARLPEGDVGTNGIDATGNLVSGDARILKTGPVSLFHQRVAVTDATSFDLNANLMAAWLRDRTFDNFEVSTWLADLNGFHGWPFWRETWMFSG